MKRDLTQFSVRSFSCRQLDRPNLKIWEALELTARWRIKAAGRNVHADTDRVT